MVRYCVEPLVSDVSGHQTLIRCLRPSRTAYKYRHSQRRPDSLTHDLVTEFSDQIAEPHSTANLNRADVGTLRLRNFRRKLSYWSSTTSFFYAAQFHPPHRISLHVRRQKSTGYGRQSGKIHIHPRRSHAQASARQCRRRALAAAGGRKVPPPLDETTAECGAQQSSRRRRVGRRERGRDHHLPAARRARARRSILHRPDHTRHEHLEDDGRAASDHPRQLGRHRRVSTSSRGGRSGWTAVADGKPPPPPPPPPSGLLKRGPAPGRRSPS